MKYRITHLRSGQLWHMCHPKYNHGFDVSKVTLGNADHSEVHHYHSFSGAQSGLQLNQELYRDSQAIMIEAIP